MSGENIAIDLSHTSDVLAQDILNFIDKRKLSLTPIASHSNFRVIAQVARNLPDEMAQEIIRRGGVIGLNFMRAFLGSQGIGNLNRQVEHASKLGVISHLCFGSDFLMIVIHSKILILYVLFFILVMKMQAVIPK